jgi:hypothetical protein
MNITSLQRLSPLPNRPRNAEPENRAEGPASPQDSVEIAASRPTSTSRGWLGMAALAGLTVACTLLSGCGTSLTPQQLGATLAPQTPEQDAAQALRFEVIPEAAGRVDIIRQTHTETDRDSDGDTTTREEKDPLQPVGVYLGNGLYLDAGLNLSLVPDRLTHAPLIPQDFSQLEIQGQLGSWSRSTVTQSGNQVTIRSPLQFSHTITRDSENQTTLQLGSFSPFQKFSRIVIQREGNKTTIQGWAPRGLEALSRIEITREGNTTTVHPFGLSGLVDTRITQDGNQITVQPFGGGFSRTRIERLNDREIKVTHPLGLASQHIERGETGINSTERSLGSGYSSIERQGDNFVVREPGIATTTTIRVTR